MKFRLKRTLTLALMAAVFAGAPVFAQAASTMTDAHIARIKANCQTALATLSQIHTNDSPIYINRNQMYFSISDKLMARLNSRLTLNRYDATQLVKTASDYNAALTDFRTAYKNYDNSMTTALGIDCTKQPVGFYDAVIDVRTAREQVRTSSDKLSSLIAQYQQQVQQFKDQHFSSQTNEAKS